MSDFYLVIDVESHDRSEHVHSKLPNFELPVSHGFRLWRFTFETADGLMSFRSKKSYAKDQNEVDDYYTVS